MLEPEDISKLSTRLQKAGAELRGMSDVEISNALCAAALELSSEASAIGQQARTEVPDATGLHPTMVDWALKTTFATINGSALSKFRNNARADVLEPQLPSVLGLVLAGNVFTACVRAVMIPIVLGVPVLAKASSIESVFPHLLKSAFPRCRSTDRKRIRSGHILTP